MKESYNNNNKNSEEKKIQIRFLGPLPYIKISGLAVDHKKIYWWTYIIHTLRDTLEPLK